ncbi:MAG: GNAT family N-acetyltransferase [Renibacterium salmoninarum]|nr:GNAT family N-acetyltransferase [Renibacterium salmoninarum]
MARTAAKAAPWSASPEPARASSGPLRVLAHEDTAELQRLVARDPIANIYLAAHLEQHGTAAPVILGTQILGYDDGGLRAACWVGANVIPAGVDEATAPAFGEYLAASGRRHASIYGSAAAVLGIFAEMERRGVPAKEVRANQPLLTISSEPLIEPDRRLRPSRMSDFDQILPAAVAMFEEEVGYSPYSGGEEFYRRRVASLIRNGHSLSSLDECGEVIFKADLGVLSRQASQVQGVWLRPEDRGRGLSAGYMAAVVQLARKQAPVVSLYVNDYNARARASYERVGFEQIGSYATVLF